MSCGGCPAPPPWPGWRRTSSSPWGARTPPKPAGVEGWDPPTPPPQAVSGGMVGAGLGQLPWSGGLHGTPPGQKDGKVARGAPYPGTCAPLSLRVGWGLSRCCVPTPCPWDLRFYTVVCRIKVMLEGLVVCVLRGGCGHDAMVAGTAWAWTPEQRSIIEGDLGLPGWCPLSRLGTGTWSMVPVGCQGYHHGPPGYQLSPSCGDRVRKLSGGTGMSQQWDGGRLGWVVTGMMVGTK